MLMLASVTSKLVIFIACVEVIEGFPVIQKYNSNALREKGTSNELRGSTSLSRTNRKYNEKPWWEWTIFDWGAYLGIGHIMDKPLPEIIRTLFWRGHKPTDGSYGHNRHYSNTYPTRPLHAVVTHSPSGAPHSYYKYASDQHGQTVPPHSRPRTVAQYFKGLWKGEYYKPGGY